MVVPRPQWAQYHVHAAGFVRGDWETGQGRQQPEALHGECAEQARVAGAAFMGYDRFCMSYQRYVVEHGALYRVDHKAAVSIEVGWYGAPSTIFRQIMQAIGLACPVRRGSVGRCCHGPHRARHDLGWDRWVHHAQAYSRTER